MVQSADITASAAPTETTTESATVVQKRQRNIFSAARDELVIKEGSLVILYLVHWIAEDAVRAQPLFSY